MAKPEEKKDIIARITAAVKKHGKIKGANKKETRLLRAQCLHHRYNKHNKVKATLGNDGNGYCDCDMCKKGFPARMLSNGELKERLDPMEEIVNQGKYLAVAADMGKQSVQYWTNLAVMLSGLKRAYKLTRKVASKADKVKKKKKHGDKSNHGGSETYGGWR